MNKSSYFNDITAAVMIGGRSRRFGRDKVLENFDGVMLIEKVVSRLRPLFNDIILIGHLRPELAGYNIIPDIIPGCGPLGGIYTALTSSSTPYCFIFAADMPNLNSGLIKYMAAQKVTADIIIPKWSQGYEPLFSLYSTAIAPFAGMLLEKGIYRIRDLFNKASIHEITENEISKFENPGKIFANINTMTDFKSLAAGL